MYDYAVVIGRFQLPHKEHIRMIEHALGIAGQVIVLIGSSEARKSLRNPFTVEQRMSLLQRCGSKHIERAISRGDLIFCGIEDSVYSDQWWVEHVQRTVKRITTTFTRVKDGQRIESTICLVGCNRDDTTYYLDMFPQWPLETFEQKSVISATLCRNAYYEYGIEDNRTINQLHDFTTPQVIEGLKNIPHGQYEMLKNRYLFVKKYQEEWGPGPHYTADAVVIKSGHILLIQRGQEPDIGAWAFPGGFVDHNKETDVNAAIRECEEETGLSLWETPYYFPRITQTYQKPFRDDRGDIRTHACLFDLGFGELPEVKGQDDAAHAQWVPVADLRANNMMNDHYHIYRDLIRRV